MTSMLQDHCLQLPDGVKEELYNLAVSYGYDPNMSTAQTIAWVAEFIRSVGTYKLNVSRQPTNFDFALSTSWSRARRAIASTLPRRRR